MSRQAAARIYALPESLDELVGPSAGTVILPRHIDWGPHYEYDLADEADLLLMYERVIREAQTAADLRAYLNAHLLRQHRTDLFLPAPARATWQARFSSAVSKVWTLSRHSATSSGGSGTGRVSPGGRPFRPRSSWRHPVSVHFLPRLGPSDVQNHPAPALRRQDAIRQGHRDRLLGTQTGVVHAGEQPHQPPPAGPPVASDGGNSRQQGSGLGGVGDHPRVDLLDRLGDPPVDVGDRIATELPCSIAYPTAFTSVIRLCRCVSAAATAPSCFSRSACSTTRITAGSIRSVSGRDALSAQRRASRTSASAARNSGRGTTNAQFQSACRSSSSLGRPRTSRSIASVIAHGASLVSLRVFAATCGQRMSR